MSAAFTFKTALTAFSGCLIAGACILPVSAQPLGSVPPPGSEPACRSEASADPALPALTNSALLLAAQNSRFVMHDPQSGYNVESYALPPGWQGFGKVTLNMDPTGDNMLQWFSGFYNPQDSKVYVESSAVLKYTVPINKVPFMANPRLLADVMKKSIAERAHYQDIKFESINIINSKDAELVKIAAGFAKMGKSLNPNSRALPLEAQGRFSFFKNGEKWLGESDIGIAAWETPMLGGVYSTMMFFNSAVYRIYPEKSAAAVLKDAKTIVASRKIDPEWERLINQIRTDVGSGNIEAARKRAQIWQKTGEDIGKMRQDSWNKQQQSQDRISKKRSDQIRGVTSAPDPFGSGRTVQTNANAKHVWIDSSGRQLNTEDGSYNPNSDKTKNNREWRQIR
ncbi:hypothetical protein IJT93_12270 [bacterium]|nr:hypothetical protein [bacterium]